MAGDYEEHEVEVLLREGALLINDGYRAKNSELSNTGIPFARAGNIDGGFHFEDADRVPAHTLAKVGLKRSLPGDVVFTSKGTVGRFAFVREGTPEFVYSPQLCYWRAGDVSRIHPRWLFYWMNGREFFLQFKGVAGQTDMAEYVSLRDQRAMKITLPPLAEQKAIASVLGALDDKIELNRRMNATLEAMARALFQSWFVDFDPVRAKLDGRKPIGLDETTAALFPDSFQDSPIGPIPHAWIVKDLGEIADFDKGLSYKGEGLAEEGGMPMVNLGCFTGRGLFNANRVKRYTGAYRERHLVRAGDLVIANTDMTQNRVIIGSPAIVPELNGVKEFLFTHHVFAVRFKPDADVWRRYAFFTLLKPEFREIAEGFSTGTTVLALPRDGLANYSLCLPPIPLLEAFEKQVGPILATVDANLQQSRTLATLRDTLLPKLLSGKLSTTANLLASTKS